MTQTFKGACEAIMDLCQAETWIAQAPDDPAAASVQFPFAAIFPGSGESRRMSDWRKDLHTAHLEIHWAFRDLPRDTADAKDHLDDILATLWDDPTLNGTVDTLVAVDWEFGPMRWGAVETLGYLIKITFKQATAIT